MVLNIMIIIILKQHNTINISISGELCNGVFKADNRIFHVKLSILLIIYLN